MFQQSPVIHLSRKLSNVFVNYFIEMMMSLLRDLALVKQKRKQFHQSLNTDLVGDHSCLEK